MLIVQNYASINKLLYSKGLTSLILTSKGTQTLDVRRSRQQIICESILSLHQQPLAILKSALASLVT